MPTIIATVSGEQTLPVDWGKSSNDLDTAPTGVQPAGSDPDFPAALEGNYVQIEGRPDKDGYVGFAQEVDISGKQVDSVEDVKSKATRTAKYAMKKKMLKDRFGYDITEV